MRHIYIDEKGKVIDFTKIKEEIEMKIMESNTFTEINKKDNIFKRKAGVIKDIVKMSVNKTVKDEWVHAMAASVGLQQGLKYNGDFKRGVKAAIATEAVMLGVQTIGDIIVNYDVIKEA